MRRWLSWDHASRSACCFPQGERRLMLQALRRTPSTPSTGRVFVTGRGQRFHLPRGRAMDPPSLRKQRGIEFLSILRVFVEKSPQRLHFSLGRGMDIPSPKERRHPGWGVVEGMPHSVHVPGGRAMNVPCPERTRCLDGSSIPYTVWVLEKRCQKASMFPWERLFPARPAGERLFTAQLCELRHDLARPCGLRQAHARPCGLRQALARPCGLRHLMLDLKGEARYCSTCPCRELTW
jgi:hypothetical protein